MLDNSNISREEMDLLQAHLDEPVTIEVDGLKLSSVLAQGGAANDLVAEQAAQIGAVTPSQARQVSDVYNTVAAEIVAAIFEQAAQRVEESGGDTSGIRELLKARAKAHAEAERTTEEPSSYGIYL